MVSASLAVAEFAAEQTGHSPARDATLSVLRVGRAWAGPYAENDRAELMAVANKALAGKLSDVTALVDKLTKEAGENAAEIKRLKEAVANERANAAKEWQSRLDAARQEAKKARDRMMMAIFFGLGALLVVGGVVILVLAGQFGTLYPALGPKAAFAVGGSGLTLISIGIAINAIEDTLERHPWIVGAGCGIAILMVAVAVALVYANHHHSTKKE